MVLFDGGGADRCGIYGVKLRRGAGGSGNLGRFNTCESCLTLSSLSRSTA